MEDSSNKALFLALSIAQEALKEALAKNSEELKACLQNLGVGTYVQDRDTGLVYKVVKPTGTFTYYKDIDYVRTAKEGERAGTLSKKEAEEAGFVVLKKA